MLPTRIPVRDFGPVPGAGIGEAAAPDVGLEFDCFVAVGEVFGLSQWRHIRITLRVEAQNKDTIF